MIVDIRSVDHLNIIIPKCPSLKPFFNMFIKIHLESEIARTILPVKLMMEKDKHVKIVENLWSENIYQTDFYWVS